MASSLLSDEDWRSLATPDVSCLPTATQAKAPVPSGPSNHRLSAYSSRSSSASSISVSSIATSEAPALLPSCASTCDPAVDDCATQRFVVWAAVRRNACRKMPKDKRLECPLLRCTRTFRDHEHMLQHLVACKHLASGEYWCYDHSAVERFDHLSCAAPMNDRLTKRSATYQSKRSKLRSVVAKTFATALGHTSKDKCAADHRSLFSPSALSVCASRRSASSVVISPVLAYSAPRLSSEDTMGHGSSTKRNNGALNDASKRCSRQPCTVSTATLRHKSINEGSPVELPSTGIAVELDSTAITACPKQGHPSNAESAFPLPCTTAPTTLHNPNPEMALPMLSITPFCETTTLAKEAPVVDTTPAPHATAHGSTFDVSMFISPTQLGLPDCFGPATCPYQDGVHMLPCEGGGGGITTSLAAMVPIVTAVQQAPQQPSHEPARMPVPSLQRPPRLTSTAPRSKNLSPSSSVRSTTSTTSTASSSSTDTALSVSTVDSNMSFVSASSAATSIVSPLSDCGGNLSHPIIAQETIPRLEEFPFDDFLENSIYPNSYDYLSKDVCQPTMTLDEDHAYDGKAMDRVSPGSTFRIPCWPTAVPTNVTEHCVSPLVNLPDSLFKAAENNGIEEGKEFSSRSVRDIGDATEQDANLRAMAASVWELLLTRTTTAQAKLHHIDAKDNNLAAQLKSATPKRIMDTGIAALQRTLVTGDEIGLPFDALCLLELVHAFSIVTYGAEAAAKRATEFGTQALAYSSYYDSLERKNYVELVSLLWEPEGHVPPAGASKSAPSTFSILSSSDNIVTSMAKTFMDGLEMSASLGSNPALFSHAKHSPLQQHGVMRRTFCASVSDIVQKLRCDYSTADGMDARLHTIQQNVLSGALDDSRGFELELLQAGRACLGSSSPVFLDDYVPRTRSLCAAAYALNGSSDSQRASHYAKDIRLFKALISETERVQISTGTPSVHSSPKEELFSEAVASPDIESGLHAHVSVRGQPQSTVTGSMAEEAAQKASKAERSSLVPLEGAELGPKCMLCDYRAKGRPQWFQGSMAKHMKNKHAGDTVFYQCSYQGCNARFRNRMDNLQQHERLKHGGGDGPDTVTGKRKEHHGQLLGAVDESVTKRQKS